MESLNELIKTYVHNLSIFYCKKINEDDKRLNSIIEELKDYIREMIK